MLTDEMTPRQFAELAGVDLELARLLYQAYGLSVEEYGAIFQNPDDYAVPLIDVFEFLLEQRDKGVVNLTGEQADKVDDLKEQLDIGLEQLRGEKLDPHGLCGRRTHGGGGDPGPSQPDPLHRPRSTMETMCFWWATPPTPWIWPTPSPRTI